MKEYQKVKWYGDQQRYNEVNEHNDLYIYIDTDEENNLEEPVSWMITGAQFIYLIIIMIN